MRTYNEEDYKNALEVIKKCQNWAKEQAQEYKDNADFPYTEKLMLIESEERFFYRGRRDLYLTFTSTGFIVTGVCGDGYRTHNDIGTNKKPYRYDYNCTEQMTIDLAVYLVNHWDSIKERITNIMNAYRVEKHLNHAMLANFKV